MEFNHDGRKPRVMKGYKKLKNKILKKADNDNKNFTVSLHPLFFAFGVYYAISGRLLEFLIYTLSALLHEFGHAGVASANGYSLNNLSLMPYGATVSGNFDGLKFRDEFAITVAGPITSLCVALLTTACWWFFPDTYPYTYILFEANLALGLINLLPAKPLDGGKLLSACLSEIFGARGEKIFKATGLLIAGFLGSAFVALCIKANDFFEINFSLLFFALFITAGAFSADKNQTYIRSCSGLSCEALNRGVLVSRQMVSPKTPIKRVVALLDKNKYNEISVVGKDRIITQDDITARLTFCPLYKTVGECYEYLIGNDDLQP